MTYFNNQTAWVENLVGNKFKYIFLTVAQILLGLVAIILIQGAEHDQSLNVGIAIFGIFFPCLYLYALKCLLVEYKKLK